MNQKFPKQEKLKSSKAIEKLFSEGKSAVQYPLKMIFKTNTENSFKVAFSVPKRRFKLAVTRNRIKRQLREVYRLNKEILKELQDVKADILFIYVGKEPMQYQTMDKKMKILLKELVHKTATNSAEEI